MAEEPILVRNVFDEGTIDAHISQPYANYVTITLPAASIALGTILLFPGIRRELPVVTKAMGLVALTFIILSVVFSISIALFAKIKVENTESNIRNARYVFQYLFIVSAICLIIGLIFVIATLALFLFAV
jgi:hypothetical protein